MNEYPPIIDLADVALKKTRYGYMMYPKHDMYVGKSLDLYGEFSFGEASIFDQLIHPGQTVLDIGANIGAHTLFFANKVGQQGRVFAFEPQRLIYQLLLTNLTLNSIFNTICYQIGLADKPGKVLLPVLDMHAQNNFGGLGLELFNQGESVDVKTLDQLELETCHFIKIDVEGMEERVLKGGEEFIRRFRPLLYVENDRFEKSHDLIAYLLEVLEYKLYWHTPYLYNPDNFYHRKENVFGGIVSINMLCIPAEKKSALTGFRAIKGPDDSFQI